MNRAVSGHDSGILWSRAGALAALCQGTTLVVPKATKYRGVILSPARLGPADDVRGVSGAKDPLFVLASGHDFHSLPENSPNQGFVIRGLL